MIGYNNIFKQNYFVIRIQIELIRKPQAFLSTDCCRAEKSKMQLRHWVNKEKLHVLLEAEMFLILGLGCLN